MSLLHCHEFVFGELVAFCFEAFEVFVAGILEDGDAFEVVRLYQVIKAGVFAAV